MIHELRMENKKQIENIIDNIIEELNEPVSRAEILSAKSKLIELKLSLNIGSVSKCCKKDTDIVSLEIIDLNNGNRYKLK